MQTLDFVLGLHNCQDSPNPSSVYIRLCKHRKKVFYCFYKITFPRKKKNSLFRLLISLSSREVLYTKLNVICSCFAIKMLSKKGHSMFVKIFQLSSDEEMGLSCKHISRPIRARTYYLSKRS